jgi:dihydrolipoamide dehydrogenase
MACSTGIDLDVAKTFQNILKKQGMEFMLETKVTGATKQANGTIKVSVEKAGTKSEIETGAPLCLQGATE